jgi:ammonia channel protein AmtB
MSALKMLVGTRIDEGEESVGLDRSQHGESSYLDLTSLV